VIKTAKKFTYNNVEAIKESIPKLEKELERQRKRAYKIDREVLDLSNEIKQRKEFVKAYKPKITANKIYLIDFSGSMLYSYSLDDMHKFAKKLLKEMETSSVQVFIFAEKYAELTRDDLVELAFASAITLSEITDKIQRAIGEQTFKKPVDDLLQKIINNTWNSAMPYSMKTLALISDFCFHSQ